MAYIFVRKMDSFLLLSFSPSSSSSSSSRHHSRHRHRYPRRHRHRDWKLVETWQELLVEPLNRKTADISTKRRIAGRSLLRTMFGTKLRTWMEAHIVRSKKKKDRKKGEKGFDSNCNSPRNHGSHRSSTLHQVSILSRFKLSSDHVYFFFDTLLFSTTTYFATLYISFSPWKWFFFRLKKNYQELSDNYQENWISIIAIQLPTNLTRSFTIFRNNF